MDNKPQNSPTEAIEKQESQIVANSKNSEKSELIRLAKENLDYTKLIYKDTQKIRKFMFWRTVINIVWIVIVVAPAIAALIYLPTLFGGSLSNLFSLLKQSQGIDMFQELK